MTYPLPSKNSVFRKLFRRRPLSEYRRFVRRQARLQLGIGRMSGEQALTNLIDISAAFDARGIQYSLTAGTLLGAVREGDFIGHDNDTDLMIPIGEFDPQVLVELKRRGFELTKCFGYPDDGMELTLVRQGVVTDLFFLYPRGDETYFCAYPNARDGEAVIMDYIFPEFKYGNLEFKGHQFQAPTEPELFLSCFYGDSWRVPTKAWDLFSPPNGHQRGKPLDLQASRNAIAAYLRAETGVQFFT